VIDICNWSESASGKASATAAGRGGRLRDGDAYGNYNVLFHYPDNVDVTFSSTQLPRAGGTSPNVSLEPRAFRNPPYTGALGIWGDEAWASTHDAGKDKPDAQAFSVTGNFTSNLELPIARRKKAFVDSIPAEIFTTRRIKGESAISCILGARGSV